LNTKQFVSNIFAGYNLEYTHSTLLLVVEGILYDATCSPYVATPDGGNGILVVETHLFVSYFT
jgi:hypothetical protein